MITASNVAIQPLAQAPDAVIRIPGSKSITNRVLLLAALADGVSTLENTLFSEDSHWCMACLRQMGIVVEADAQAERVIVHGRGGYFKQTEDAPLFVGNSGTTARFLVAAAALGEGDFEFDGVPRMRQRPIGPLLACLRQLGGRFSSDNEAFPLIVHGGGLAGGPAELDASASSQYLTALLQVAPYAKTDVTIRLLGKLVSEPYIEMTLRLMEQFGIDLGTDKGNYRNQSGIYSLPAGQRYSARHYHIEPDASNASYFFAAAALTGGRVRVPGLRADGLQGDTAFVEVLAKMGCVVRYGQAEGQPYIELTGPRQLSGVDVDMNAISDTAQTLAAIAPFATGPVHVRNIGHIRLKETDRIAAVATELRRLGVQVDETPDSFTVYPSPIVPNAGVDTYDDHRMAMAFSIIGLAQPGIIINNPSCTAKTFPDFFTRLGWLRRP
jgi:3-phosphoshikimate 1-carboxyvinyltransferase